MIYDIPRQFKWYQANKGDFDGTIWSSRNIDLKRNSGTVSPTEKLIVTTPESADTTWVQTDGAVNTTSEAESGFIQGTWVEPATGGVNPTVQAFWSETAFDVTSVTKSITVPAGTNQLLVVQVLDGDFATGDSTPYITGATYNGVSLTSYASFGTSGGGTTSSFSGYYAIAPTQTTADVVVTIGDGSIHEIAVCIYLLEGAFQSVSPVTTGYRDSYSGTSPTTDFDLANDGFTTTGFSDHLLVACSITSPGTHSISGGPFDTKLSTTINSNATVTSGVFGELKLSNPIDLATSFCKETGTSGGSTGTKWWATAGTSVYYTSTESGDFDIDDSGTLPTTDGKETVDMVNFDGKIYACWDGALYERSGSVWTAIDTTSAVNNAHCLAVYANRLYIATDTTIISMDTVPAVKTSGSYTLDLFSAQNENLWIKSMRATSNGIWFIASNNQGGRAKAFLWDGNTANTLETQKTLDAGLVNGLTIKDDIPYILDANGILSKYNGSYFQEVARFDFDFQQLYRFNNYQQRDSWIHPNGIQTIDGEILMAINTRDEDGDAIPSRHPAGIYAYNEEFGIYHKYSFTAHENSTTYYDNGHLEVPEVGAIFSMHNDNTNNTKADQSDFLVGYSYKSDNATTKYVIAKSDKRGLDRVDTIKVGVIITPFLRAEQVQDQWKKLYTFIRPFKNTTDKIVVKMRKQEYDYYSTDITWVDTTSFTSTDANWATIKTEFEEQKDFEVEGLAGDGAGYCSHITDITEAGGTYTITIDETIANATTNTARVRVTRWEKVNTSFTDEGEVEHFKEFNPDMVSTKAQFKLYLAGTDIELDRLAIYSSPSQKY